MWLPLVAGCEALRPRSWQCTFATLVAADSSCQPLPRALEAKAFLPVGGKAKIYLARPSLVGGRRLWDIQIDGRHAGVLAEHTYLVMVLAPGAHEVSVLAGDTRHAVVLVANAGEISFVEALATIGWTESRAMLRVLPREQGEAGVRSSKLAAPL